MRVGVDTTFIVEIEVEGHPKHAKSQARLESLLDRGDTLVLAPQVLVEFIHVVTDERRFERPLDVKLAVGRAEEWWNAREVGHAFPNAESVSLTLQWLKRHKLGRKRLLDTQLAATYHCSGVRAILSSNPGDFEVFAEFEVLR